jgi:hypothetical protein
MISAKKEKLKIAYAPCAKGSWLDNRVYDIREQSLEILKRLNHKGDIILHHLRIQ